VSEQAERTVNAAACQTSDFRLHPKNMAKSIKARPKKRGRPATGKDPLYGVRIPDELMADIQAWATPDHLTRSEAIRRLVELGLTVKAEQRPSAENRFTRRGKATKASDMAGRTIDRLSNESAPTEEKARRKRRLIEGPAEFRDMRDRAIQKRDRH
jgi:hypothetical protein